MTRLSDAREAIAQAVTTAGVDCHAYPPDSIVPPVAFIEGVAVEYIDAFCTVGQATFSLVVSAQRNDRATAMYSLEELLPEVVTGLSAIDGLVVQTATSGVTTIGGLEVPALLVTATATV